MKKTEEKLAQNRSINSDVLSEVVNGKENNENEYKTLRVTISGYNIFKEIAVQPICDEEGEAIISSITDEESDEGDSFYEIEKLNMDLYGLERPYFYFVPSYCTTNLSVYEIDEDDEEKAIIENKKLEISPNYSIMTMEEAIENYEDDPKELEVYKKYLTETKFGEGIENNPIIANSLIKAWKGLSKNEVNEYTFLPTAISEAIRLYKGKKAIIKGCDMDDDFDISFYIRLPKNKKFDKKKLDFVCIDADYDDYSCVLQEHLACDLTCLNMIIYDGVVYFASNENTLLFGGSTECSNTIYDIIDTNCESLNLL